MSPSRPASRKANKRKPRAARAVAATRENGLAEFFERVESTILDDWMMTCPNAELGRRMMKPWLDDIRWENRQRYETGVLKRITNAIDNGAETLAEIRLKTGLHAPQVDRGVAKLIRDGLYFWIRQGGEPEMTKGSRPMILHKVGEPYGT